MPGLVDVLYPAPPVRPTPLTLIRWWEGKRLLYNQVVGSAGLVTLAGLSILIPEPMPPLFVLGAAVAYGVMANICFSIGWGLEILARWVWGRSAPRMGPLLFREGLIFSVGLTLFPLMIGGLVTLGRILSWIVERL